MARSSRFRTRRGRPASSPRPAIDSGTPELIAKRTRHQTEEQIDQLLREGIISPEMHRSALRFRWLYTLRFGCPGVRALDLSDHPSAGIYSRDEDWKKQREDEYRDVAQHLAQAGIFRTILQVAVFDHRPPLTPANWQHSLRHALLILQRFWNRENKHSTS